VLTSDHALGGPLPGSAIVIGGNYIGIEFASLYSALGARVTLVEQLDRVAPHEDADVSRALAGTLAARGIGVRTATTVVSVAADGEGVSVTLRGAGGGEETERAELVLVAVGREPRSDEAGLRAAGVELEDGYIVVDDEYRTSVPTIWAVGDAVRLRGRGPAHPQLAHVAFAEGMRAAEAIAGAASAPLDYEAVPHVIYGEPEVAAVGLTEDAARAAGHDVRTQSYDLSHNARALMFGSGGFVKTVTDAAGTVLGVHVLGPHASEILAAGTMATAWSARVEEVAALVHAHPTVGEAFGETALALAGTPLHAAAPKAARPKVAA
jgi:dihydrolipoamide dehydrogenase